MKNDSITEQILQVPRCSQCNNQISYPLSDTVIRVGFLVWCNTACWIEWLHTSQEANKSDEPIIVRIDRIPRSEWQEASTADVFHTVSFRLLQAGMNEDDIVEILTAIYNALEDEFETSSPPTIPHPPPENFGG